MKFAFLGYSREWSWDAMSKGQQAAMIDDCFAYDTKLLREGRLIEDGAAMQPTRTAKTVRWRDGAVLVTDGPYAETKEQLGGIGILEAADMSQAVELLSKHPGLRYGATFEIRPVDEESLRRKAAALAACRGAAPAADPRARKFVCLGYIDESRWGSISKGELDAVMEQCIAFDEGRVRSGQWLTGVALQGSGTAKTLRAKAGQVLVTDGPFAETKEQLGGVVVLALEDRDAAVASMSKHPALRLGVAIEIRPADEEIGKYWDAARGRVKTA